MSQNTEVLHQHKPHIKQKEYYDNDGTFHCRLSSIGNSRDIFLSEPEHTSSNREQRKHFHLKQLNTHTTNMHLKKNYTTDTEQNISLIRHLEF